MSIKIHSICLLATTILLGSCTKEKQFSVEGKIANAEDKVAFLERREHSTTTKLDSVKLDNTGEFKFIQKALDYPEFYRVRVDNEQVNFVIDSTETIQITGDFKNNLTRNYSIEGSEDSKLMQAANRNLQQLSDQIARYQSMNTASEISDAAFNDSINIAFLEYKDVAKKFILQNFRSPSGYYILFLTYNNNQLLSPYDKDDLNLYRSVATVWDGNFSNSPRNEFLKSYTLSAVAERKKQNQMLANMEEISKMEPINDENYFVINLPNLNGELKSTNDLKGKVVLLDFTVYNAENSAQRNILINSLYEKYKGNLEIYQVSFDTDEYIWKNVADNLPWVAVRDNRSLQSPLFNKFNIRNIPTTYILNRKGEIVDRLKVDDDIEKMLETVIKNK